MNEQFDVKSSVEIFVSADDRAITKRRTRLFRIVIQEHNMLVVPRAACDIQDDPSVSTGTPNYQ